MTRTKAQKMGKLNLSLPEDTIVKAKTMAAQMRIPVSHLIEGLLEGIQIVPGKKDQN